MLFVSGQLRSDRLAICKACEHYEETTQSCGPLIIGGTVVINGEDKKLCGCVMPVKAALRVGSCPLQKWDTQMSEKEYKDIKRFIQTLPPTLNASQQLQLVYDFNKVTGENRTSIGCCGASARSIIKTIEKFVYETEKAIEKSSKR